MILRKIQCGDILPWSIFISSKHDLERDYLRNTMSIRDVGCGYIDNVYVMTISKQNKKIGQM